MKTPKEFQIATFAALREGGPENEQVRFDQSALAALREELGNVPSGEPITAVLKDLAEVAGYLFGGINSPTAGKQLLAVLDEFAGPELKRRLQEQVDQTNARVEVVAKKFESFLGPQGEKLPDTGARLDPKLFKKPIRG